MALSQKAEKLFTELENSCDSQALAVADCLRSISENGEEQEEDKYLSECAEEIEDWARYAREKLSK